MWYETPERIRASARRQAEPMKMVSRAIFLNFEPSSFSQQMWR
jgi:hypothetical protein